MIGEENIGLLRYCSPYHGGWDIARMALLLPQSHILFICPYSCARIITLNAVQSGTKEQISVLGITEEQIVSGDYESLTVKVAQQVVRSLDKQPKVLILFMSCIDSLLTTDHQEEIVALSESFPDTKFVLFRMNPICRDSSGPPLIRMQRDLYDLLEPSQEIIPAVNYIGCNIMLPPENEQVQAICAGGYQVRHLSMFKTFQEFCELSNGYLNIVGLPLGLEAAQAMKRRLGIDFVMLPQNFDFADYSKTTSEICHKLNIELPDFHSIETRAEEALGHAAQVLNGFEVVVDSSAVLRPFSLAKLLVKYGFNVRCVYVDSANPPEKASIEWLQKNAPQVEMIDSGDILMPDKRNFKLREGLAIGLEASCYHRTTHTLDLFYDNGLWGYQGVIELANRIENALLAPYSILDVKEASLL